MQKGFYIKKFAFLIGLDKHILACKNVNALLTKGLLSYTNNKILEMCKFIMISA